MNLRRPVIDAESAYLAEYLLDDGVARYAGAAHHLNAAIGDPHQRFRYRDLRHRAFRRTEVAGVVAIVALEASLLMQAA